MRQVTATCAACGKVEISTYAGVRYRCTACTSALMDKIRRMADDGLSQGQIATQLGCTQNNVSRWCMKAGIVTNAASKQQQHITHGIGEGPARLMPTAKALGMASVWGLAGHAPTVFRSPV